MRVKTPSPIAKAARIIFERLQSMLEQSQPNAFVAIEPISGEYFLGETLSDAIGHARLAHPTRTSHVFRVGHQAAIYFGMQIQ